MSKSVVVTNISGNHNALSIYDNTTNYPTAFIRNNGSGDALFVGQKGSGLIADFHAIGNGGGVKIREIYGDHNALNITSNKTNYPTVAIVNNGSGDGLYVKQEGSGLIADFRSAGTGGGVNIRDVEGEHNALNITSNKTSYPTVAITNNGSGTALFVKQEGSGELAKFYSS